MNLANVIATIINRTGGVDDKPISASDLLGDEDSNTHLTPEETAKQNADLMQFNLMAFTAASHMRANG